MMLKTRIFACHPRVSLARFTFCWWRNNRLAMTSQWPDNCDANTWQVISNSLDIGFIHGDIHGRSCKNEHYRTDVVLQRIGTIITNSCQLIISETRCMYQVTIVANIGIILLKLKWGKNICSKCWLKTLRHGEDKNHWCLYIYIAVIHIQSACHCMEHWNRCFCNVPDVYHNASHINNDI